MKKVMVLVFLVMLTAILLMNSCSAAPVTTYATSTQIHPASTTAAPATTYTHPNDLGPSTLIPQTTQTYPPVVTPGTTNVMPVPGSTSSGTIGLAVGGAKDINNFRQNILNNYLPLPTDVSYEGLFYDYYFDTGAQEPADKLFSPSYSYAVTQDPLSHQTEYYLSVGLNSGIRQEDFQRKTLNLVIVLDSSGSMGEYYDQYYYDQYGNQQDTYAGEGTTLNKIDSAKKAIVSILGQLKDNDRFSIVQFNSRADLVQPMRLVSDTNMKRVKDDVMNINAGGSTDLSAGFYLAVDQFRNLADTDSYEYENRIIVLTDAQPNAGDFSGSGLSNIITWNADNRIYTTFIGVGVDFNTELIDMITKVKGANYYSIRSPKEFRERVDDEFDYMVTPMVFNVNLTFESSSWKIDTVFGCPEADLATGGLMTINTLFPSKNRGR